MRVKLHNKWWVFKRVPNLKDDGIIDAPDIPNKHLKINSKLRGKKELETILHEALHGCIWNLSEEDIQQTGEDLANLLWKLGYRCQEKK